MDKKIKFTPYHMGVLVEIEIKETTDAGIILPESHKTMQDFAYKVVAVGPGCVQVKPNDWVLLKADGVKLNIEGEDYGFVQEHQIFGVFPEKPITVASDGTGVTAGGDIKLDKTIENIKDFNKRKGL
jgi:co-chaperonin GroES (HSP10)